MDDKKPVEIKPEQMLTASRIQARVYGPGEKPFSLYTEAERDQTAIEMGKIMSQNCPKGSAWIVVLGVPGTFQSACATNGPVELLGPMFESLGEAMIDGEYHLAYDGSKKRGKPL